VAVVCVGGRENDSDGEEAQEEKKNMMTMALALYRGGRATRWRHAGWTGQREAAAGDHGVPGSGSKIAGDGGRWRPVVGD
jgi:hypothetical protein